MIQCYLWMALCLFVYLGLFSLEYTRVHKSLSKY